MKAPVTIAVVSSNTRELLADCLRSLKPEVDAGRADVWVVDNASSDGSPDMVGREFPWVSLVAHSENIGFSQAVNLVADRTDSPWLAPANADIAVTPGALLTALDIGARHPEAAVIAPRLVLPDGRTQHSVYSFPTLTQSLALNFGLQRFSRRLGDRLCFEGYWDSNHPREVDWAIAAFVVVRRDAFDAVGGFDRQHWMYAEDLDLGWRLRAAGWKTRYAPEAAVRHFDGAATRKAFGDDRRPRWMAATYAWMVRRRGIAITWAYALINLAGAGIRWAILASLSRVAPGRWGRHRDFFRQWMRLHRQGLRSRGTLLSHR
jgi:GT2 family glycosyltransferase